MTKVSVIVPTYCPGPGLDRVIASLDAQTMPQAEFESVFVDDGSPDDTLERLKALAAERPNMRVTSIPNSGWPSRPRNVGLDMAVGEFVVFMDHDDHLYPRALEAAYEAGVSQKADVVNGKEVRTNELFAYWPSFQRDVDASEPKRPQTLSPWTTHKLFRRSLLVEHGIRFEEGVRVLWEDVMVDVSVYAATDRIAVLASEPFYQWVHTPGENASGTYGDDLAVLVGSVARMFEHVDASDVDDEFRAYMKSYQYGLRILHQFVGPRAFWRTPELQAQGLGLAREFADTVMPATLDALLSKPHQARSALLRSGRLDLIPILAETDADMVCVPTATAVAWDGGVLVLDVEGTWTCGEEPLVFRRAGDRLLRVLPDEVAGALPAELLDVTDEVAQATVDCAVTSRRTRIGWPVPVAFEIVETPRPDLGEGLVTVGFSARVTIDPRTVGFGHGLEAGAWTVSVRSELSGVLCHRALLHHGKRTPVALVGGQVYVASTGRNHMLSLEVDTPLGRLLAVTRPLVRQALIRRAGLRASTLSIPVEGAAVAGETRAPVTLRLQPVEGGAPLSFPAVLVADADGLRLEARVRAGRGRYRLLVEVPGAGERPPVEWLTPGVLTCGRTGRVTVARVPVERRKARVWGRGFREEPGPPLVGS